MNMDNFLLGGNSQNLLTSLISDDVIDFMTENRLPFDKMMAEYQCAIMEIETKFKVLDKEYSLQYDRNPIEYMKTRVKSMESIMKKCRRKNIPWTMDAIEENIKDIAGVRVVCSFPGDIYKMAECLLQQDDVRLIERKDYIENPKESGYRSLHLIVEVPIFLQEGKKMKTVEVQLRTIAMDFWASLEHKVRYKKNIPESEVEQLAKDLVECADQIASIDQKMEDIRDRIADAEARNRENAPMDFSAYLRNMLGF